MIATLSHNLFCLWFGFPNHIGSIERLRRIDPDVDTKTTALAIRLRATQCDPGGEDERASQKLRAGLVESAPQRSVASELRVSYFGLVPDFNKLGVLWTGDRPRLVESAHALYVHVAVCTAQGMYVQVLQNEQQARRAGHALPKTVVFTAHIQKSTDARKQACLSGYNRMFFPSVAFPAVRLAAPGEIVRL